MPVARGAERVQAMAVDVNKHLDRGKRYLERNKLRDAVAEYEAVVEANPGHSEALQSLADIYARLNEPVRAAHYYGLQFDRLVDGGDGAKATALYSRFLKTVPQPPERLVRYALLLQRQGRGTDAIEVYASAAQRFRDQHQPFDALECLEKIAVLDPENPARHLELAESAERLANTEAAARGYLRAGQLILAGGDLIRALDFLARAHRLIPSDRTTALYYATACLRLGDAAQAVTLLESFSPDEADTAFHAAFGEALLRTGQLDRARAPLEAYYRQKPDSFGMMFELADAYLKAGEDAKAVEVLSQTKEWMRGIRRENEFATQVDSLGKMYPDSLLLGEFSARFYEELNRETRYFDALVRLFDLYWDGGKLPEACETLDRLIDIDPYDYRNHERIARLEGRVDPAYLRSVVARAAKAATVIGRAEEATDAAGESEGAASPASEEARARQALDDLVVQVEIFLQYSLQAKAVERLERIAEMFPGEEETNDRLRALYERANWWPKGVPPKPASPPPEPPAPRGGGYSAETRRDLTAIAEITRLMYRQATPREVLAAAVHEIGKYLAATRCLAAVGPPGETPMTAEFSLPGVDPAGATRSAAALSHLSFVAPDTLGGIELPSAAVPALRELGLQTGLGVQLTDKETQTPSGLLLVGDASARAWKPNESFFLQSVGDQLVQCVNHTRLRSLVRTLAVADEKTGLLSRGAYLDCLLTEANRAKVQGTPLSLAILQIDGGPELLREHGDAALEGYIEQLAGALKFLVRQGDLAVKYTAWSIGFILPDTTVEYARMLAEKLRQAGAGVHPSWAAAPLRLSAVVAEASRRPSDETEDRVTEWINRSESGLDEVRHRGGDTVVCVATPN